MLWARWPACLWPGLPQLWLRGNWSALALAVGFAWSASLLLATTFVWTEWIGPVPRGLAWIVLVMLWLATATANLRWLHAQAALERPSPERDLFPAALNEYLQGNWYAAERQCLDILSKYERDAEALLLLSTVYRHAGQLDKARERLTELERLDAAARWKLEIENEKTRLKEKQAAAQASAANASADADSTANEHPFDEITLLELTEDQSAADEPSGSPARAA